ncbi:MAG TPA: hypothetical protein VFX59_29475 [Polyangiales bacterium]|nr:hypothetical protein [Polyangiales bacterium]
MPARPSGVMPAFRGSVSLPAPPRVAPLNDDAAWAAARQRALALQEEHEWAEALARARVEEEREWEQAIVRARAAATAEEREWAALRARVAPRRGATSRRVVSWP